MSIGYLLQENGDYLLQETDDQIIIDWNPADSANRHTLRLLYGNDKRRPVAVYDIAGNDPGGNVFLEMSGFVPATGDLAVEYREAYYLDGGQRYYSRLGNIKLSIKYYLRGDSAADLENVRAGIERFVEDARLYHEQRQGERIWLEYCWADGLAESGPLRLGQRERYYEVLHAWPSLPADTHGELLFNHQMEAALLELECGPLVEGLEQPAGDCAGLVDAESDIDLTYSLTDDLGGNFTISLWLTHQAADYVFFEYYLSATEYTRVWWDNTAGTVKITNVSGGVTTTTASSALALAGPTQMIFSNQTFGSAVAYINAAAAVTASYIPFGPAGQLRAGGSVADTGQVSYADSVDGLKIWSTALSATLAATLYNNEWPIKKRQAWIGRPVYHKTIDGAGTYHAVDGVVSAAEKDNWGVIGNVPGSAPARVRWAIDPPTSNTSRAYWLGNKIVDAGFTPLNVLFLDFNETADSGNSSGDGYYSSGSGTGDAFFSQQINVPLTAPARGRFQVLARMRVSTNSVTVRPYFKLGSSTANQMDAVTVGTDANFLLRDLGDIWIDWPQGSALPYSVTAGLVASRASTATVDVDFMVLLPYPSWRVEAEQASLTLAAGDTLIVEGRNAYVLDASDNDSQLQRMEFEGCEVAVWPKKYNYIFLLQGEEGSQYVVSRTATVRAYVTPRWLAGGGPAG